MGGLSPPAALLPRPPRPSRPLVLLLVLLLLPNSPASSSPFTGPATGPIYTLQVRTAAGVKPLYVLRGQHPVLVGRRFCRRHDSYRECRQILAALCGALPCAGPAYTLRLANQGARTPLTVYAGEEASDAVHYFVQSESLPGETAAQLQQHLCAAGIEGVSCAHAAPAKVLFFLVLAHHHSGSPNDGHAYELDFTDRDKATDKEGATGNNRVLNGAAVRVAAEFCGTHGWLGEQCSVRDIAEELTRRSELGDAAERARREGRRFAVGASPWDVLGLDEGADDGGGEGLSKSAIRKAYRRQSLQWHPDKCGAGRGGGEGAQAAVSSAVCQERFLRVADAYQLLMDGGPALHQWSRGRGGGGGGGGGRHTGGYDMTPTGGGGGGRRTMDINEALRMFGNGGHDITITGAPGTSFSFGGFSIQFG